MTLKNFFCFNVSYKNIVQLIKREPLLQETITRFGALTLSIAFFCFLLFVFLFLLLFQALVCIRCIQIGRLYNLVAKTVWLLSPPPQMFNWDKHRMLEKTSFQCVCYEIYIHIHAYVCMVCVYKCGKHSLMTRI